jgi:hypothetical protein
MEKGNTNREFLIGGTKNRLDNRKLGKSAKAPLSSFERKLNTVPNHCMTYMLSVGAGL